MNRQVRQLLSRFTAKAAQSGKRCGHWLDFGISDFGAKSRD